MHSAAVLMSVGTILFSIIGFSYFMREAWRAYHDPILKSVWADAVLLGLPFLLFIAIGFCLLHLLPN